MRWTPWIILLAAVFWGGRVWSMPVFRSPDSPIPSGELNPRELKGGQVLETRTWVRLQDKGWIQRDQLVRDIDLSQWAMTIEATQARRLPQPASAPHLLINAGQKIQILGRKDHWVEVAYKNKSAWIYEESIRPIEKDSGLLMTKASTPVRVLPSGNSKVLLTASERVKIRPLEIKDGWAFAKIGKVKGWVNLHDCFSRLDFAKEVEFKNKWYSFESTIGPWVKFGKIHAAHMNNISSIKTDPMRAIVLGDTPLYAHPRNHSSPVVQQVNLGDVTTILETETLWWAYKQTPRHGSFWWSLNEPSILGQKETTPPLTTKSLFSRGIFDLLSHTKIRGLRFASADGIFRSLDDETWEPIPQLGQENLPIAQSPNGTVYIGMFKSSDGGQTFKPYVRWDQLLATLSSSHLGIPGQMKLGELKATDHQIEIKVTGQWAGRKGAVRLISPVTKSRWKISKIELSKGALAPDPEASYDLPSSMTKSPRGQESQRQHEFSSPINL